VGRLYIESVCLRFYFVSYQRLPAVQSTSNFKKQFLVGNSSTPHSKIPPLTYPSLQIKNTPKTPHLNPQNGRSTPQKTCMPRILSLWPNAIHNFPPPSAPILILSPPTTNPTANLPLQLHHLFQNEHVPRPSRASSRRFHAPFTTGS
jgi:hypothetical protein